MIKDTNDKHICVGCHRRRPGARLDLIKISLGWKLEKITKIVKDER